MKFYSSILFKLIAGIFIVEFVVMLVLEHLIHLNVYFEMALDIFILSAFMAIIFYLYLKRPLNKIFSVVEAVKNEQFNVKTGIRGEDEISKLGKYIDNMAATLQETRDKEVTYNEELRVTNEELQTSTDELQTAMAEQQAINAELEEAKAEAEKKYAEIERVHKLMLGREKRVIELKEENEKLKEELSALSNQLSAKS